MRKIILLLFLLVASDLWAVVTKISVSDVSSNVTTRSGPFSAKMISFVNDEKLYEYPSLLGSLELFHSELVITWPFNRLNVAHNLGEQVDKLKKFSIEKFSGFIQPDKAELSLLRLLLESNQNEYTSLSNFILRCYNPSPTVEISTIIVLESCAAVGTLHADRIEIKQNKRSPDDPWNQDDGPEPDVSYVDLRPVDMTINGGRFNLDAVVKSFMSSKLKVEGEVYILKETSTVVLKINKAKVGIVDIKGTMLKKIAETKLSRIRVDGDRIIIYVGPAVSLEAFQNL